MAIAINFNDAEAALIEKYAAFSQMGAENFVRQSVMRRIERDKDARNAEYLAMLDRGFRQMAEGRCRPHELIEVGDE